MLRLALAATTKNSAFSMGCTEKNNDFSLPERGKIKCDTMRTQKSALVNGRWYSQFSKIQHYRKVPSVFPIADLLGFQQSSIYRELKRGQVTHLNRDFVEYVTYSADRASDEARLRASAYGSFLKIADDFALVCEFNHWILHHKLT